jgi:hypothetical protein
MSPEGKKRPHLNSHAYNECETDEIPIIWTRIIWKLESRIVGPSFLAIKFLCIVASKGHLDKNPRNEERDSY